MTTVSSAPPASGPTGRPDLEGSLVDLPLTELFDLLAATGKTGAVAFGEPVGATLWVTEGRLGFGASPGSPEAPRAPHRGRDRDRRGVRRRGGGHGCHQSLTENLVDLFEADRERIEAIAHEQVITTAFEVLVVGADHFAFYAGERDPLGAAVSLEHPAVLVEAERRRAQWQKIAELIPSTGIVVGLSPELPGGKESVTFTADEWTVLSQLDGYRTVADVIAELGQSAFEVCGVLYELLEGRHRRGLHARPSRRLAHTRDPPHRRHARPRPRPAHLPARRADAAPRRERDVQPARCRRVLAARSDRRVARHRGALLRHRGRGDRGLGHA